MLLPKPERARGLNEHAQMIELVIILNVWIGSYLLVGKFIVHGTVYSSYNVHCTSKYVAEDRASELRGNQLRSYVRIANRSLHPRSKSISAHT